MLNQQFKQDVVSLLCECPPKTAIVSDIDGTLHPIIDRPEHIQFYDYTPTLLENLAEKYALVGLITGRSMDSALQIIKAPGVVYVANHGMEICRDHNRSVAGEVQQYLPQIRTALEMISKSDLANEPGIFIEDKYVSVAVHYRQAPEKMHDVEALLNKINDDMGLKLVKGRKVRELHPPVDINKGSAIESLLKDQGINLALYLGDDLSDIHAFRALKQIQWPKFQSITIGVRSAEVPQLETEDSIDYLINNVEESIELLGMLL